MLQCKVRSFPECDFINDDSELLQEIGRIWSMHLPCIRKALTESGYRRSDRFLTAGWPASAGPAKVLPIGEGPRRQHHPAVARSLTLLATLGLANDVLRDREVYFEPAIRQ